MLNIVDFFVFTCAIFYEMVNIDNTVEAYILLLNLCSNFALRHDDVPTSSLPLLKDVHFF